MNMYRAFYVVTDHKIIFYCIGIAFSKRFKCKLPKDRVTLGLLNLPTGVTISQEFKQHPAWLWASAITPLKRHKIIPLFWFRVVQNYCQELCKNHDLSAAQFGAYCCCSYEVVVWIFYTLNRCRSIREVISSALHDKVYAKSLKFCFTKNCLAAYKLIIWLQNLFRF